MVFLRPVEALERIHQGSAYEFDPIVAASLRRVLVHRCPAVPPEIILLPRWFYINIYEMSSWSRAICCQEASLPTRAATGTLCRRGRRSGRCCRRPASRS